MATAAQKTTPHRLRDGETRQPLATPTVSVVLAAKNEASNIEWVLRRIPDWVDQIVLVDGLSRDRTIEIARLVKPDLLVVHEDRPGKGAAIRSGFEAASGDYLVMLDADGSMDPGEIHRFTDQLSKGHDLVKGSRFIRGGGSSDITSIRKQGNRALLALTNILLGTRFTELCYGYMAIRRSSLGRLDLSAGGFDIEAQLVTQAHRRGLRVVEVASYESPRRFGESNLHAVRDGFRVLGRILRERFRAVPAVDATDSVIGSARELDKLA